ncbi:MAG: hypothetical protein ABW133_24165 [Polyangiaceae bacterium]
MGFVSCGGSAGDSGPLAQEDFPKAFASAVCDNIGPCCMTEGFPHDAPSCRTNTEADLAESMKDLAAQGAVYDGAAARSCVDAYAKAAKSCGDSKSVEATCDRIFRGTRTNGEPCSGNEQCASRSCRVIEGMTGSRCAPEPTARVHAKHGDACGWTCEVRGEREACTTVTASSPDAGRCYTNDGLFCFPTGICGIAPRAGDTCKTGSPCADDNFCVEGTCSPRHGTGPCTTSDSCNRTAFCDEITKECKPLKALGEPCSTLTECQEGLCIARPHDATQRVCGYPTIAEERLCSGGA